MRMYPTSHGGMSTTSSVRSFLRRRSVPVPTVQWPDCGLPVKQWVSSTKEHDGWVFYSWRNHGTTCDFWKWELEYVQYLVAQKYIVGDDATGAFCAADEKRSKLEEIREANARVGTNEWMRGKLSKRTGTSVAAAANGGSVLAVGREIVLLLKVIIGTVLVLCVLSVMMIMKK